MTDRMGKLKRVNAGSKRAATAPAMVHHNFKSKTFRIKPGFGSSTSKGGNTGGGLGTTFRKLSIESTKKKQQIAAGKLDCLSRSKEILNRCEEFLKPLDVDELLSSVTHLKSAYADMTASYGKRDFDESSNDHRDIYLKKLKTISQEQAFLKKKLEKVSHFMTVVSDLNKLVDHLADTIKKDQNSLVNIKKKLYVEMKSNFHPLFFGSIGYENESRTDPNVDNLSEGTWDSKSVKRQIWRVKSM